MLPLRCMIEKMTYNHPRTPYTSCIHLVYILYTSCIHLVYILHTSCIHLAYILYTSCIHLLYTLHIFYDEHLKLYTLLGHFRRLFDYFFNTFWVLSGYFWSTFGHVLDTFGGSEKSFSKKFGGCLGYTLASSEVPKTRYLFWKYKLY